MRRWPIVFSMLAVTWPAGGAMRAQEDHEVPLAERARMCRFADAADRERCLKLAQELHQAELKVRALRRDMFRQFNREMVERPLLAPGDENLLPLLDPALGYLTRGYVAPGYLRVLGRGPRLGVNLRMRADEETDGLGAMIDGVVEDGPAAEAGLQAGDVVTHWDGEPLAGRYPPAGDGQSEPAAKLIDLARELEDDQEVELTYLRDGESRVATVKVRQLDLPAFVGGGLRYRDLDGDGVVDLTLPQFEVQPVERLRYRFPGLTVFARGRWEDLKLLRLSPELGEYFGAERGLLVVEPPSEDPLGLEIGDVILAVGDREPRDTTHLLRILRNYDAGETINVEVIRQRRRMTLSAELPESEHVGLLRPSALLRDESI